MRLARRAEREIPNQQIRENLINLLETIIIYKLPEKSREEIAAMFELSDLKKTRFYQEIREEVQAEAQAKIFNLEAEAKEREKVSILRMFSLGLSREQIGIVLDLSLAEIDAILDQSHSP